MRMLRLTRYLFDGWGRRAAWAMLAVFVSFQAAIPSLFYAPRLALFDLYQYTTPRLEHASPVVIVAIDDASLKTIGQWPWPRQINAQLISKILAGKPASLGIDMILPEADRQSPEEWLRFAGDMPPTLSEGIRRLPSHDAIFGQAIAAGPVMLGIGGLRLVEGKNDTGRLAPFRLVEPGGASTPPTTLPSFNAALRSVPVLDNAASGHGMLSVDPDPDGVFRRVPLVSVLSGRLAPSMGLEMLRLTAKASWFDLYVDRGAVQGVGVDPLKIPTQADGSVWVHFSPHDSRRYVSAADVLSGRTEASTFEQRIVLVGVTGLGTTDLRMTAVGYMPGTEITAQLLENVLDGRLAQRPDWTRLAEPALTLIFGIFLIVTLPFVRPRWQALLGLVPLVLSAALGFGLWQQSLLLVDVATPAIGEAFVFVSLLAGSFAEADTHRRRLHRELEAQKLAAAKVEGEMEAGRRIQMGMLPGVASVAGDSRFDLGALMVPARQIGGDLYDFFKVDSHKLFFAVGDVSGKGVPAALFMALGKSLCKSYALRGTSDVGAIINMANAEISRDNPEMLFITMFAGIFDLDTGEVQFCNAGHDAPFVLRKGAGPESVVSVGGPPLCVVEDFTYPTETLQLHPGDLLCVTTDGVAEAMDGSGALLGVQRTRQILADITAGASAKTVVDELYAAVGRFVAGAEASDDLTVLAIRWNGP
jgi:serine phosphatase RsbU (regulator of sigma subunit)/CHASE2 domain-containing sensor protein